ncbi:hypothetical protein A2619_03155 [candidate division WWE3 bacterium RIFOXYD1_FULL_39_9]|uniref:RNHCP domain-containing protein n=1 Tax=candidate division WWE3 bacterium RIFOXYD1_FULL_39_9 TaxID=1802649 RepID=A0A1F4X948_UNCKA|nr:MAG: hypothetical protein A2619_03155 [candidate division WWE3 bacterium RIFOXYD1_FULL_39_9]
MNTFICSNCSKKVRISAPGTRNRNHCPFCLYSVHIDNFTGDRKSNCHGSMEPIGKYLKKDGEEVLVHKCVKCGFIRANRVAGDDSFDLVEKLPILAQDIVKGI